ncbi:MAG: hypothetical protein JXJ04_18365 [Spirochaetales bacterium]|nr:hypothetical protein [Spirochaetales bacterium]
MEHIINIASVFLILVNFRLLATSRIMACIQALSFQALLLGIVLVILHPVGNLLVIISLIVTTIIKGMIIPWFMRRTTLKVGVDRELEPFIGYTPSIVIGALLLGVCIFISNRLGILTEKTINFFIPITLFTMMSGLFLIIARKKAITQVAGYLSLENGIYAFGMAFTVSEPLIVEIGILTDVFTAIFIMGITIYHINKEFDHIDIDRLSLYHGGK